MEVEDLVIATFVIGIIGTFFVYASANTVPFSNSIMESVTTGFLCVYALMNLQI